MTSFAHLHVHTDYSLLDGACAIPKLIERVSELGQTHVAITDHGNMYGALEFYNEAKAKGINPIVGFESYLAAGSRFERKLTGHGEYAYHLTLLAMNTEGYRNLCKLASIANLEGYYYRPRIDMDVLQKHSDGLISLSGCVAGRISSYLLNDDFNSARAEAVRMRELFGDRFYLEVQNHGLQKQRTVNSGMVRLSEVLDIPLVATNDAHYISREDSYAHEILLCIGTKKRMSDQDRMKFDGNEYYIKSADEMLDAMEGMERAVENSMMVAERCKVELKKDKYHLPRYTCSEAPDPKSELRLLAERGAVERFGKIDDEVRERLDYELKVIDDMGFNTYFLVVQDFIAKARERGVPVGPGRGSAAGSLVSYCLRITDVDPLRFGLLFERFLNPGRHDMPDIDIDFCQERRQEVLDYVVEKYGEEKVAQVITFGTLGARAVVRDVGRVLDIPISKVDAIAKKIPSGPGKSLKDALVEGSELYNEVEKDKDVADIIRNAKRLEGLARNPSVHACAVVIGDDDLKNYLPLGLAKKGAGEEKQVVTQYSKDWVESIGLLKMDFLGLQTLTTIEYAQDNIELSTGKRVELDQKFDDEETFELLCSGRTMGVFQLESPGMRRLIRRLKPECFEDIIALLALYRPGPLEGGMVDSFVECKHGRQDVTYMHPKLKPILETTYGVILYQEQVMRIVNVLGGFSLGEADRVRKAMGKKIDELMEKYRERFVENAPDHGCSREKAEEIVHQIETFAGYGFNKSHSAAYAVITYHTAYLKAHYPLEFMAAVLSSVLGDTNKLIDRLEECKQAGYKILPPDVNESARTFIKSGENGIRFALGAIKGVGGIAADLIYEEARRKPFRDLFDLCERVDLHVVNKGTLDALISAGATESLEGNMAQQLDILPDAISNGQSVQAEAATGQIGLFDGFETPAGAGLRDIPELPRQERLAREFKALGFFLSGHPVNRYDELGKMFSDCRVKDILASAAAEKGEQTAENDIDGGDELSGREDELMGEKVFDGQSVVVLARLAAIRRTPTKKGDLMAMLTVEDATGSVEGVCFPDYWKKVSLLTKDSTPETCFFVAGQVDFSRDNPQIKVFDLITPEEVFPRLADYVILDLANCARERQREKISRLKSLLEKMRGDTKVALRIDTDEYTVDILLPSDMNICASSDNYRLLKGEFGEQRVLVKSKGFKAPRRRSGNGKGRFRNGRSS